MRRKVMVSALIGTFLFAGGAVAAQAQQTTPGGTRAQAQEQEQIFGSQLMTPEERTAFRERMRSAATADERERVRREHHEQMRQRAAEPGSDSAG